MITNTSLRRAMRNIASKKGDFTIFARVRRSDALGTWDLVVSAPWLEEGHLRATRELVELLSDSIGESSFHELSRIVPLGADHPMLTFILENLAIDDGELRMQSTDLFGPHIEEGVVFRAKRPMATRQAV